MLLVRFITQQDCIQTIYVAQIQLLGMDHTFDPIKQMKVYLGWMFIPSPISLVKLTQLII